ncbi:unnamed protein product [Closterium sp. NIES-54]
MGLDQAAADCVKGCEVTVSEEEISGVTEDGGEPEVEEQQQQQQQDARQGAARPADRPRRDVRPPNRLTYPSFGKPKVVRAGSVAEQCDEDEIAHCYWAAIPEPKTLAEALSGPDAEKWKQSVKEEYDSLLENETWELCELPPGKKAISSKPIFRHKYGPDGELTRYKSRLVAKGFQQKKGKDFDEIFAPVGKGTTLRVMLGMAANHGWKIKQMDITTAFLNGIILEELYMLQPEGLDDGSGRVCRLKKAIYGLKQAPRAWYHKLEETLLAGGFKKSECDYSLFLLQEKEQLLMLLVYVDDILLFSESAAMIERVEEMLEMQFKCSKIGDVKYYLGMHVERDLDKGVLRLHQRKYYEGLAEKYGLQDGGKPATPLPSDFTVEPCADEEVVGESDRKLFHSMVGALNYAANHTRPDIAFATSRLASVVSRPSHEQLEAAKRLVRYVSATASVGLEYSAVRQRLQRGAADLSKGEMLLTCYTDASFNSVKADGTSIGGYVCLFGGGAVSWRSKKQNEVGLSSCETEYMALHHGVKEVVWLRGSLLCDAIICIHVFSNTGGAAGIGAATGGTGAVPVGTGGPARQRPYFVPLLEQVLGLPPSPGPAPPLECPQPVLSQSPLQPVSPLPTPSPYAGPAGGLAERCEPASRSALPVRTTRTSRRAPRPRPSEVPGKHQMTLRPSTAPLRVPLPSPSSSSLPVLADPASDSLCAASPTVARLLSTVVTDPSFESTAASALFVELVEFAARCRLDYAASLVAESASNCPPSVGGECALSTDVLEDRQEEFQCFAAALPHLVSTLIAREGDPDAPDILTPRSYTEAIEGPYSSQWQSAMDAEMAS